MKDQKNTTVFSGLQLRDVNLKTSGEMDFIVISLPLKTIIHVEAKTSSKNKKMHEAAEQLNRGQTFFEENFPFPSSENWNYTKMMCFGESVKMNICENCKPFILSATFILDNTIQSVSEEIANQFLSFLHTIADDNNGNSVEILVTEL